MNPQLPQKRITRSHSTPNPTKISKTSAQNIPTTPQIQPTPHQDIFGIGMFEVKDTTSFENKNHWKSTCKCDDIYYPSHRLSHRNTIFLVYHNKSIRDAMFSSEELEKVDNVTVLKQSFEIAQRFNPCKCIQNFFSDINPKYDYYNISKEARLEIKQKSMEILCKCYQKMEESADAMASSLTPDLDSLQWFLFCEILLFIIYKFPDIDNKIANKYVESISELRWNEFNKHLKNKKRGYETKVFIIDMLWQFFFNQNDYKESLFFQKMYIYVTAQ